MLLDDYTRSKPGPLMLGLGGEPSPIRRLVASERDSYRRRTSGWIRYRSAVAFECRSRVSDDLCRELEGFEELDRRAVNDQLSRSNGDRPIRHASGRGRCILRELFELPEWRESRERVVAYA